MIPRPEDQRTQSGFLEEAEREKFDLDLLVCIFETVRTAWDQLVAQGKVDPANVENSISDCLAERINKLTENVFGSYHFTVEWRIRRRSDPCQDKRDIEYDILIFYHWQQIKRIFVECKRLSNSTLHNRDDLARDYIKQGVLRFVQGKYARGEKRALMWGFVLDGDLAGTAAFIAGYFLKYDKSLSRAWQPDTRFGGVQHLYNTEHLQDGGPHRIELLHLFLPFKSPSNSN